MKSIWLRFNKGQSVTEVAMLIVCLVGALIVMQGYIQRAFQGNFKRTIDDIGPNYDPAYENSTLTTTRVSSSNSEVGTNYDVAWNWHRFTILGFPMPAGYYGRTSRATRMDVFNERSTRQGSESIGPAPRNVLF